MEEVACKPIAAEDVETAQAFRLLQRAFTEQHALADHYLSVSVALMKQLLDWITYACMGISNAAAWVIVMVFHESLGSWIATAIVITCNVMGIAFMTFIKRRLKKRFYA